MQTEIDTLQLALEVRILGINESGHQGSNAAACQGKDLPWLQDVPAQAVWDKWDINFRDVIILDEDNEVVGTYNLTDNNLSDPAKYAALKNMLIKFAGAN